MKIFALFAAMMIYFSVAMQHAVGVINYPNPGIQLPEVEVKISKKAVVAEQAKLQLPQAIALN